MASIAGWIDVVRTVPVLLLGFSVSFLRLDSMT